jgi:hypothetical protein
MESKEPVVKGIAYLFWEADGMLYWVLFSQEGVGGPWEEEQRS